VFYLLRLVLPDRPGALGAVATALGGVGADITSVDVIERGAHHAVDDLVVELPAGPLADSLITAADSVRASRSSRFGPTPGRSTRTASWRCSTASPVGPMIAAGARRRRHTHLPGRLSDRARRPDR